MRINCPGGATAFLLSGKLFARFMSGTEKGEVARIAALYGADRPAGNGFLTGETGQIQGPLVSTRISQTRDGLLRPNFWSQDDHDQIREGREGSLVSRDRRGKDRGG